MLALLSLCSPSVFRGPQLLLAHLFCSLCLFVSGALLWPSRDPLGTLLASLGALLEPSLGGSLGALLAPFWALLGPSWRPLGLSRGPLGTLLIKGPILEGGNPLGSDLLRFSPPFWIPF